MLVSDRMSLSLVYVAGAAWLVWSHGGELTRKLRLEGPFISPEEWEQIRLELTTSGLAEESPTEWLTNLGELRFVFRE